jgi:prevent-host-death family protein
MCVMAEPVRRVGIRELRQNLSVYLRRIQEDGQPYEVTEHGHAVARLTPLPNEPMSPWNQLVADGQVTPAGGNLLEVEPLDPIPGVSVTETLLRMRDEETW